MIINMVGGGGGAALNFKVVPGLTQPGTASENTVWVKTEKINAWYFSATQPEGLQEWDVWFPTGTPSDWEFNALKKNGIQVYPLMVKQMVSGTLEKVFTSVYKNGKWENAANDLFVSGLGMLAKVQTLKQSNAILNIGEEYIEYGRTSNVNIFSVIETEDTYDLSKCKYVKVKMHIAESNASLAVYVTQTRMTDYTLGKVTAYVSVNEVTSETKEFSLPLGSDVFKTGSYIIGLRVAGIGKIYDWYLE